MSKVVLLLPTSPLICSKAVDVSVAVSLISDTAMLWLLLLFCDQEEGVAEERIECEEELFSVERLQGINKPSQCFIRIQIGSGECEVPGP